VSFPAEIRIKEVLMRKDRQKGSALILASIIVSMLSVATSVLLAQVSGRFKICQLYNQGLTARYAAEAGIEQVKYYIKTSLYDTQGNMWLNNHSSPEGFLALEGLKIGDASVEVVITDLQTGWHRITSTATLPDGTSSKVAMEAKGRDLFSKYMFFTHLDDINIGTTTVRGDVHSNRSVNFYFGGAHMFGNVTACRGIGFYWGATPENTTFYKEVDGYVQEIPWPKTSEIAVLHDVADGVYQVSNASPEYAGFGRFDTEITFDGDEVIITAKRPSTGEVLKTGRYPLPENNLIFVQGPITSLKGDLYGRVTIATMDRVDITGKIRYVDAEGDPAYQLYDSEGMPVDDTPHGVVWDGVNYLYKANPDYDPAEPSVCAIMALKDITIVDSAPYNMEMHAVTFSSQGRWCCSLRKKKGNLRVLGSMTQKLKGWRYSGGGYGWAKSGEYIYDQNLLSYPPEHYLEVDSPVFSSWRVER
jgi:hypothetical protein